MILEQGCVVLLLVVVVVDKKKEVKEGRGEAVGGEK